MRATCMKCGKNFVPAKYKSTIGCPECVKKVSEEIARGIDCNCLRCGASFISVSGHSTITCRSCVKDIRDGYGFKFPTPIYNRFEILDIR